MFLSCFSSYSSQAHKVFFSTALIFLLLFLFLLLLNYSSLIYLEASLHDYHSYALIFVVFPQFFIGFLYTVFPRFLNTTSITRKIYIKHFYIYFFATASFFLALLFSFTYYMFFAFFIFLAQVFSFSLLFKLYKESKVEDKYDAKWILISFFTGLTAHFLYFLSFFEFQYSYLLHSLALNAGFYLYLFSLIFAVSQRMVPFFTRGKTPGYVINKSKYLMEILYVLLFLKVILLSFDSLLLNLLADIPLFVFFTKELLRWKLPIKNSEAILWILHLSLLWIPIGFFVSICESLFYFYGIYFEKAVIHIFALGFFLSILLGFATRVVLGHSGQTQHANKITVYCFIFLHFLVILRFISALFINTNFLYLLFIKITLLLLLLTLCLWSFKYLKILLK